jgi:hypothetical protein
MPDAKWTGPAKQAGTNRAGIARNSANLAKRDAGREADGACEAGPDEPSGDREEFGPDEPSGIKAPYT